MSMHSGGFELMKLTYARLEDNLVRLRGATDWDVINRLLSASTVY